MAELTASRIANPEPDARLRVAWAQLTWASVVAAIVAVAGTATVYFVASASGVVDERVVLPSLIGMGPLSLVSVSLTAVVVIAGASIVLGLLAATTRRPIRIFRIVTSALALASLSMPATIPGPPVAMRLTMIGMHVVVWAASVGVLATLAGGRARAAA